MEEEKVFFFINEQGEHGDTHGRTNQIGLLMPAIIPGESIYWWRGLITKKKGGLNKK